MLISQRDVRLGVCSVPSLVFIQGDFFNTAIVFDTWCVWKKGKTCTPTLFQYTGAFMTSSSNRCAAITSDHWSFYCVGENSCGEVVSSFALKKTRYNFVELWVCVQWMLWCCTCKPSVYCVITVLLLHFSYYWFLTRQCAIAEGVLLTFRDLGNARRAESQAWAFCRH